MKTTKILLGALMVLTVLAACDFVEKDGDWDPMVWTIDNSDEKTDIIHEIPAEGTWMRHGDVFKYAVKGPVIRTATLCFRRSLIVPYLSMVGAGNDTILQAILAKQSHFARWTRPTSVYRLGGVSNAKKSLQKELIYQDYFSTNRRLKHQLFPEECPLDEDALSDRGANILLKMAIRDRDWKKALQIKSGLKTEKYRKKPFVKCLWGPVSCFFLSNLIRKKYD